MQGMSGCPRFNTNLNQAGVLDLISTNYTGNISSYRCHLLIQKQAELQIGKQIMMYFSSSINKQQGFIYDINNAGELVSQNV